MSSGAIHGLEVDFNLNSWKFPCIFFWVFCITPCYVLCFAWARELRRASASASVSVPFPLCEVCSLLSQLKDRCSVCLSFTAPGLLCSMHTLCVCGFSLFLCVWLQHTMYTLRDRVSKEGCCVSNWLDIFGISLAFLALETWNWALHTVGPLEWLFPNLRLL